MTRRSLDSNDRNAWGFTAGERKRYWRSDVVVALIGAVLMAVLSYLVS